MSYRVFTLTAACALALMLLATTTGCDKQGGNSTTQPAPKGPEVGVVNLDDVAKDLGWFREMETQLDVLKKQFNNDLQTKQDQYQTEVQAEMKRLGLKDGDKLTPQQEQLLSQMVITRRQAYGQLQQAAAQLYQQYQTEWLKRYREALEPVVKDVGFGNKTKVVLSKTDVILYMDNTIDLTAAVTAAAREKPPVFSAPSRPQLPQLSDLSAAATHPAGGATTRPATTGPAPGAK